MDGLCDRIMSVTHPVLVDEPKYQSRNFSCKDHQDDQQELGHRGREVIDSERKRHCQVALRELVVLLISRINLNHLLQWLSCEEPPKTLISSLTTI